MNRRTAAVVYLLVTTGCVAVNGGAVELEWTVRTEDAQPTDCQTAGIATVSLCYEDCDDQATGACAGASHCPFASFACTRLHGATDFSIPPGRKAFYIAAACGDGRSAGVRIPEPVVRDITDGNVTQLNALLIAVPTIGGSGCL